MKQTKGHVVDLLFTLGLFCVFAATALLVVIIGANVYRSTVTAMARNDSIRTSVSYLAEKIRQGDTSGGIRLDQVEGRDALVLTQTLGEGSYETWVYTGGGELREVLVAAGTPVKAGDGQAIMPIAALELTQSQNLLTMTATDPQGAVCTLTLGARCG